jgi:excinuclease UvrABC nuclease subunit
MTASIFDDIVGMGEKKLQKLRSAFKNINDIKESTPEQIVQKTNISQSIAKEIIKKAKSFE